MRIVIVDDNPDDRLLAIRALKPEFPKAEFVEAFDAEALERALSGEVGLVITDYALRWTTGIEVLDAVRKRLPRAPAIMFTNTGSEEIAARALRHGAADYVIKRPGQFNRLATAARGALTQVQLRARIDVLLEEERSGRLEAEKASRLREEFLATLSHELRTPLHAILGWVNLLRMGALTSEEELHNAYKVLERNARAQARLIDDLLDLSRIATGRLVFDMKPVPLKRCVEEVLEEMRPMAHSRAVALGEYVDEYGGLVRADEPRLCQVIRNLVSNAIKFSDAGGRIEVCTQRVGSHVELSVSDQGIGIAPDFLPRIFERFQQADISTTRRTGGMGIGLSVAKYIVEAHGGEITASSAGLGRGAVFTVRLPVPSMLEAAAAMPAGALPSLEDIKVLVVDDDLDSLAVMRRALEQAGAEAHIAENARDALELVKARTPHLLVSDIGMPTEDGYALVRKVRELDPPLGAIPAMALTAFARPEDHQRALAAGFNAHIGKPVDAEELIRAVAALLAGRAT